MRFNFFGHGSPTSVPPRKLRVPRVPAYNPDTGEAMPTQRPVAPQLPPRKLLKK
jgi:hypothetical protein